MHKIILAIMFAALSFQTHWMVFAQTKQQSKRPQQQQKQQTSPKQMAEAYAKAVKAVVKIDVNHNQRVGTGVLIGTRENRVGLVLTAYHVIQRDSQLTVSFFNIPGSHVALATDFVSSKIDLAVILVKDLYPNQQVVTFGKNLGRVGAQVAVIGHPLDQPWRLDQGTLKIKSGQFWVSDVPVRTGNSGGPLLDEKGRMLGIIRERIRSAQEEGVVVAYRSELIIPTIEAWLEKVDFVKKWRVEEPKSPVEKVFTEPKYGLPTAVLIGGITYFVWPREPDLPGPPGFPKN